MASQTRTARYAREAQAPDGARRARPQRRSSGPRSRRPGAAAPTAARPARPLQRDCVLPISRGGRYTLDNIAPACGSCNASKCNDEVTGWLRRKRLDERAFLARHVEIRIELAARFADVPTQA